MEYLVAGSVEEALELMRGLAARGRTVRYVAGGTDLAVQLAGGSAAGAEPDRGRSPAGRPAVGAEAGQEAGLHPDRGRSPTGRSARSPTGRPAVGALVDVSGIPELLRLQNTPAGLRIGGAVSLETLARREDLPACLVQGARAIGSPQIRALGTLGGNLCNASPCGDTLAPVIVLGGILALASPAGRREVRAEEFFTGPKATVLRQGELLVEALFEVQALSGRSAFRMIGQREGQAISQVNVAVWALCESGKVAEIRAAAGSVAPTPLRLHAAEKVARGRAWSAELGREAGEAAAAEVRPIDDVRAPAAYRRLVTAALLREALAEACGGGR
jgi:CO/xanthine dehydrogenase FAD-binding subunit